MSIIIGMCALGGGYLIYRLVKMSLTTGDKGGLVMAGLIGLVILLGVTVFMSGARNGQVAAETKRVQEEAAQIQEEARERQAEADRRSAERYAAERKAQEEQYLAREQELAASRMSVDEFNAQFLAALNTERMTEPTKRTTNGAIETVTYPFDHTGELFLTEVSSFGAIKSVLVSVEKINGDNMNVAWLVYAAAVQIFTSMNDLDYIFTQLKLYPADVAVADLKNSRSVQVGNYRFQKNAGSNSVSFSIVDTR